MNDNDRKAMEEAFADYFKKTYPLTKFPGHEYKLIRAAWLAACGYMSSRKSQGWVSVKDSLPNESTRDHRNIVMIWFCGVDGWAVNLGEVSVGHWRPISGNGNFDERVTHWMSLPAPPNVVRDT